MNVAACVDECADGDRQAAQAGVMPIHIVTGASTRCTLDSSTSISIAFSQSDLTSDSLSGSQFFSCSIHLSSSDMAPAHPPRARWGGAHVYAIKQLFIMGALYRKHCFLRQVKGLGSDRPYPRRDSRQTFCLARVLLVYTLLCPKQNRHTQSCAYWPIAEVDTTSVTPTPSSTTTRPALRCTIIL